MSQIDSDLHSWKFCCSSPACPCCGKITINRTRVTVSASLWRHIRPHEEEGTREWVSVKEQQMETCGIDVDWMWEVRIHFYHPAMTLRESYYVQIECISPPPLHKTCQYCYLSDRESCSLVRWFICGPQSADEEERNMIQECWLSIWPWFRICWFIFQSTKALFYGDNGTH